MVLTRRKSLQLEQQKKEKEHPELKRKKKAENENENPQNSAFYDDEFLFEKDQDQCGDDDDDEEEELPVEKPKKHQKVAKGRTNTTETVAQDIYLAYDEDSEEIQELISRIYYSQKYDCDNMEYRHVIMPQSLFDQIPEDLTKKLLSESEWRSLGIRMSPGWEHYELHSPEPHIFLFRRPIHN